MKETKKDCEGEKEKINAACAKQRKTDIETRNNGQRIGKQDSGPQRDSVSLRRDPRLKPERNFQTYRAEKR